MLESSRALSDLLLHHKNVGTFIKSYYLLQFGCSEEGRQIIKEHRACLYQVPRLSSLNAYSPLSHLQEGIGKATLSATTYLSNKFATETYVEGDEKVDSPLMPLTHRAACRRARCSRSGSSPTRRRSSACASRRRRRASCARACTPP